MSLMGLDIGTNGCRALVVSQRGPILANVGRAYDPAATSAPCELDVRPIWAAVSSAIKEAAGRASKDPITALAIASVGEAITPLSREGTVLAGCLLGHDPRGSDNLARAVERLGQQRFHDITGRVPGPSHTLSKLCWLRENEPDLYRDTWRFSLVGGLVAHLLGGSTQCDYSLAGGTLCFDMRQKSWSRDVLSACSVSPAKLPELATAGTRIGTVAPRIAHELGLPSQVGIVLGGHDLACNALGAGVVRNGLAALALGPSVHLTPAFHAVPLVSMLLREGLSLEYHVVPDLLLTDYYMRAGGAWVRWFASRLTPLEQREATRRGISLYRTLLEEMPEEPTGLLVVPPRYEPALQPGAIQGLTLETERGELIKGLLEGIMLYLGAGQERLERIGVSVERYRATGGGARSDAWLQLCADVLDRPVERIRTEHTAALGAALLAGVGSGAFGSLREAAERLSWPEQTFEPDPRRARIYRQRLEKLAELIPTPQPAVDKRGS